MKRRGTNVTVRAAATLTAMSLGALSVAMNMASVFPLLPQPSATPANALREQSQAFVQNLGQWDSRAEFLARSPGANVWVTDSGVVYDFYRMKRIEPSTDLDAILGLRKDVPGKDREVRYGKQGHVVRMEFVGAHASAVSGAERLSSYENYFVGTDRSRWASNVPRYAEARTEHVYPGISARWYFDQGAPRYDLIVTPGADPSRVALKFDGANGVEASGKTLKLRTSLGLVEHRGLFAYQRIGSRVQQVDARFLAEGDTVRFDLGTYDKSRELIVDPLIWSTFLGGGSDDNQACMTVDGSGNPILLANTISTNFPTTVGAYDTSLNPQVTDPWGTYTPADLVVSKLAASGSALAFSTYLGGTRNEMSIGIAVDNVGRIVICSQTYSTDFPTTGGAYDTAYSDGNLAVTKLSATGSAIDYSTFFGGDSMAYCLAVDSSGNCWVGGSTDGGIPTTVGAFDSIPNGDYSGFVARLSSDLTTLMSSTYLGGGVKSSTASYAGNIVQGIAIQPSGSVVVCGQTYCTDFPTTGGAFQTTYGGGSADAFVCRLPFDCSSLQFSTFLGGSDYEDLYSVSLDALDRPVLAGHTRSAAFPTTSGAYDRLLGGVSDVFVTKLASNGASLVWSTFLGGTASYDWCYSAKLNASGDVFIYGGTSSPDFPTTAGCYDSTFNLSSSGFLAKLYSGGSALVHSTFFGTWGDNSDHAPLVIDLSGNVFVAGTTTDGAFPTTAGAYDTTHNGAKDLFVAKHSFAVPPVTQKDSYQTDVNVPLTTAAPGVLANDLEFPTSAILITGPAHAASFSLSANGSFNYTPAAGYVGNDVFVYKAQNAAGDSLPTNVLISVVNRNSSFVEQSVPATVGVGQTFTATVTMKNTGTETWSEASKIRLISQNPSNNTTWGANRMNVAGTSTVPPGGTYTFSKSFTAPAVAGTYNFQWRTIKDSGGGVFGATTPNVAIVVGASVPLNNSQYVSQTVPTTVGPGQSFTVGITMRNTGTSTWSEAAKYRLGSMNPTGNTTWAFNRMNIAGTTTVAPNAAYKFAKTFVAPTTPGTYNFQWKTIQDAGAGLFGQNSLNVPIVVAVLASRNAQFVSQTVPTAVRAGTTFTATVTMRNTGLQKWSEATLFRLGSINAANNTTWGASRMNIGGTGSVATGMPYTFSKTFTAPSVPGTYNFQWKMIQDGIGSFGASTANVQVLVY